MKLRSGWISVLAAGGLALVALFGFAGPASASLPYSNLCITFQTSPVTSNCAYNDAGTIEMLAPFSSMTNWYYPNTNGAVNVIQQVNTDTCMQVNGSVGNSAGFEVRAAACVDDQAEYWVNVYDGIGTRFESVWALDNGWGDMCLEGDVIVTIAPCSEPIDYFDWSS
jgi:hypothetical protein